MEIVKIQRISHISLQHAVVLLLSTERLLQNSDVALVVLMLLLQRLHLRRHRQDLLVSPLDLQSELIQLLIIPPSIQKSI